MGMPTPVEGENHLADTTNTYMHVHVCVPKHVHVCTCMCTHVEEKCGVHVCVWSKAIKKQAKQPIPPAATHSTRYLYMHTKSTMSTMS